MLRTLIRSLSPRTPGRSAQIPRTIKVDLHSRLRCAIQCLNHVLIEQRIHLGDDPSRFALSRVLRLAVNQSNRFLRQIEGRHQQRLVAGILGIGG